jgi:hypothetical protein
MSVSRESRQGAVAAMIPVPSGGHWPETALRSGLERSDFVHWHTSAKHLPKRMTAPTLIGDSADRGEERP